MIGNIRGRLGRHLTYANVCATVALVLSLTGGTAYAAKLITSRQLANNSVTAPKLRKGAVTKTKIAPNSVSTLALAPGAVSVADLSAKTISALKGAPGPQGPPGRDGFSAVKQYTSPPHVLSRNHTIKVTMRCPVGSFATGGGGYGTTKTGGFHNGMRIVSSQPILDPSVASYPRGWMVRIRNDSNWWSGQRDSGYGYAVVLCSVV